MKGGKWDNCNSIINKYIKKSKKKINNAIRILGKFLITETNLKEIIHIQTIKAIIAKSNLLSDALQPPKRFSLKHIA